MRTPTLLFVLTVIIASCQAQSPSQPSPASGTTSEAAVPADTATPSATADSIGPDSLRATADTLVIAMTGDIMMGTTYPTTQLPADGGSQVFRDTRDITLRADLALGNLEGTLLNGGTSTKGSGRYSFSFRTPPSYVQWLVEAGYDYVSQANNHANDFGREGILSTERTLDSAGIAYSGISGRRASAIVERGGVRYGICAFGHNKYTYRHRDLALVDRFIDSLKAHCDIVIVSFHGGAEGKDRSHLPQGSESFLGEDRGSLREFAHHCIDRGADIVFGHGPHVVRAMEVYKGKFIAYSLGNFCTPYGMALSGISGYSPVAEVRISRDGRFIDGQIHSFIQQKGVGPRHDANHSVARQIRDLSQQDIPASPLRINADGAMTLEAQP
ncbi:MAG: CapA family protein [Bacteroidaceae bacterium]|nr:CapA family protein [Bacteroidaceae bacterium]